MRRKSFVLLICIILLFSILSPLFSVGAASGIHGDVDDSGDVSAADARVILRVAVELEKLSPKHIFAADCNADGEITAADARLALRAAVGLETLNAHFFNENENGEMVCVVCGHIAEQTGTEPQEKTTAPLPENETGTIEPTKAPEPDAPSLQPESTTEPEPGTEPQPTPAVSPLRLDGAQLTLGEHFDVSDASIGRFLYKNHTVAEMTTFVYALPDGGVLFVFTDTTDIPQAFFVLSGHFSFDGVSAGDAGDKLENNADLSFFYDLSPYEVAFSTLPDRQFFCDVYGDDLIYAAFCRLPGVSFRPNTGNALFYDEIEKEMVTLTNAFRSFHGVSALAQDEDLCAVARAHSSEMAESDYFSHDSLSGSPFYTRLDDAGIRYSVCGENITAGSLFSWEALHRWVISNGHRNNMLDGAFTGLGVGAAYRADSSYQLYWTQVFTG